MADPRPAAADRRPERPAPDAMLVGVEPALVRTFRLAGEALRFETNDERVLTLAGAMFDAYGPPPDRPGDPLALRVLVHAPASDAPPAAKPVYRAHGHLFTVVLGPHDSGAADLARGVAFATVQPALVAAGWPLQWHVISALALGMLGPARGYLPLHAACLERAGRSVLVHAPSGAGKSTFAYAAVRRGYRFVSDDSLHVGGTPEPRVWGVPWQAQLLPDVARFFPELAGASPRLQASGEWKLDVDLARAGFGGVAPSAPLGPVLLLERRSGPTRIERLPEADAARAIEAVWPWRFGWTEAHAARLADVVRQGVYRFASGADPDAMVDALDAFLAEADG